MALSSSEYARKTKERKQKWYIENKERIKELNNKNRERRALKAREAKYKQNYGLTWNDVAVLYESQGKKCKICEQDIYWENRDCGVDHCHLTGKVRGILCKTCNLMLGNAKDDIKILQMGIEYLKGHLDGI